MEIPALKWYRVTNKRRSRRLFELKPLEFRTLSQVNSISNEFQPFPDSRAVFVADNPENVFKGTIICK